MYQKILVPLDGSELAESVLEHVRAVATGCSVPEVVLLTIIEPPPAQTSEGAEWLNKAEKKAQDAAENYLAKVADSLGQDSIATSTDLAQGEPAEGILDYADKNQVDLIIMSTHGRSGVARWVFGSVADRVVRHSAAPVLIVPPPGHAVGR